MTDREHLHAGCRDEMQTRSHPVGRTLGFSLQQHILSISTVSSVQVTSATGLRQWERSKRFICDYRSLPTCKEAVIACRIAHVVRLSLQSSGTKGQTEWWFNSLFLRTYIYKKKSYKIFHHNYSWWNPLKCYVNSSNINLLGFPSGFQWFQIFQCHIYELVDVVYPRLQY